MPIYKLEGSKDGKQRYRVRVNIVDADGKYKQIERITYGRAEAKDLEQKLSYEIKSAGSAHRRMTVSSLLEDYIRAKQHEIRQTSLNKSVGHIKNHVLPELGGVQLAKLTRPRLQAWKNNLCAKGLSCVTCNGVYKDLNAMLNYAVKLGYMPANNLSALGGFKEADFTPVQEKLHYYTAEEFVRYITAADALCASYSDRRYYVFFAIAYFTGMRKGEINALRWSDIDGNTIHVRRSISQKVGGGDVETSPKNKSSYRDLTMPAPLASILAEHRSAQQRIPQWSSDFRVCGGDRPLRDTTIANKNKQFAVAADLPVLRIHDFRHSHASLLANEGVNIQEIARRLGHSDVTMTWNTYSHLYPREEERAVAILDKIQIPTKPSP